MSRFPVLSAHPRFAVFLAARFAFILSLQMVNTAIGWYLYELTGDPLSLGWVGLSEVIPAISLALYAGHAIDRSDKRSMLLRGMSGYGLAVLGLGIVTSHFALQSIGRQSVEWLIYGLIFSTGIFRAFTGPTFQAIVAQLVDRVHLPRAITLSTTAWQSAAVLGPVISGILISTVGITTMFVVAATGVLAAIWLISRLPRLPVQHSALGQRTWESVKEGLRYVWRTREVLGAMSVDMFAVLFGGATAMLPVFAKDILHVDATGMGLLKGAQGVGTICMLFWLTRRPLRRRQGRVMLQAVAGFGLCILVFAISRSFWLSLTALFLSGVFDSISMVVRSTILQLYVPDQMRGRVSSVNSMFINSSNELGQFESGVAARLLGTVPSVIFGGCMTLVVVAVAWWKAREVRELEY